MTAACMPGNRSYTTSRGLACAYQELTLDSPTHLAVSAMGFALPKLDVATADGPCGLCGVQLTKGVTPAKAFDHNPEFGAFEHLHPGRGSLICAACVVVTSTTTGFMNRFSRAVFTEKRAYRLSAAEDICWMLLQAEPPFVAVFNTRSSGHVLWQAPVTYDRASIGVVLGSMPAAIRPEAVTGARTALGRLAEAGNEALGAHYQWPVFNLSLYDDVTDLCRLIPSHERVLRASDDPVVQRDLQVFDALSQAERWALSALLLARPKRSQSITDFQPPPILHRSKPVHP